MAENEHVVVDLPDDLADLVDVGVKAAIAPAVEREAVLREKMLQAVAKKGKASTLGKELEGLAEPTQPSMADLAASEKLATHINELATAECPLPPELARAVTEIENLRKAIGVLENKYVEDPNALALALAATTKDTRFTGRIQLFYRTARETGSGFCREIIDTAEGERLVALAETTESITAAGRFGLDVPVKRLPDTLERSTVLLERKALDWLVNNAEMKSVEAQIAKAANNNPNQREGISVTSRRLHEQIKNLSTRRHQTRDNAGLEGIDSEIKLNDIALEGQTAAETQLKLREVEVGGMLPAIAQKLTERLSEYAQRTYPDNPGTQRLFLEKAAEGMQVSSNTNRFGHLKIDSDRMWLFEAGDIPNGLTRKDIETINGEFLRANALKAAVLSPRVVHQVPAQNHEVNYSRAPHSYQGSRGAPAIDQYIAYNQRADVSLRSYGSILAGEANYINDAEGRQDYHGGADEHKAPSFISNGRDNESGRTRKSDLAVLTETDPAFLPELLALQDMEVQVVEGLAPDAKKLLRKWDYRPVVEYAFEYKAGGSKGVPYSSEEKREQMVAAYEEMRRVVGENLRMKGEPVTTEVVATMDDAMGLVRRLRAQLGELGSQLEGVKGAKEAAEGKAGEIPSLSARIGEMARRTADLESETTRLGGKEKALGTLTDGLRAAGEDFRALLQQQGIEAANVNFLSPTTLARTLASMLEEKMHDAGVKAGNEARDQNAAENAALKNDIASLSKAAADINAAFTTHRESNLVSRTVRAEAIAAATAAMQTINAIAKKHTPEPK